MDEVGAVAAHTRARSLLTARGGAAAAAAVDFIFAPLASCTEIRMVDMAKSTAASAGRRAEGAATRYKCYQRFGSSPPINMAIH